ncbi:MAG: GNAT family N-acetyltransferase, partial [Myxococcales bacterium]|nr:GNAT family N-acetyltransferase [Myxococcales bacterium]
RPGAAYAADWWQQVYGLYETSFPGLSARIALAERVGARWPEMTTPFVAFDGSRPVAHVGVIRHAMTLGGAKQVVAGVHGVCTDPAYRRRGLIRAVLAEAMAWAETWTTIAELHTDDPPVYRSNGFAEVPTWRFFSDARPMPTATRALDPLGDPADAALLRALLASRTPPSWVCACDDAGPMVLVDAAICGALTNGGLRWLPEHAAIVAVTRHGDDRVIADVIAETLPPIGVIRGAVAEDLPFSFPLDRLDANARAVEAPSHIGVFMVRGRWPVTEPFGISPLWEH